MRLIPSRICVFLKVTIKPISLKRTIIQIICLIVYLEFSTHYPKSDCIITDFTSRSKGNNFINSECTKICLLKPCYREEAQFVYTMIKMYILLIVSFIKLPSGLGYIKSCGRMKNWKLEIVRKEDVVYLRQSLMISSVQREIRTRYILNTSLDNYHSLR